MVVAHTGLDMLTGPGPVIRAVPFPARRVSARPISFGKSWSVVEMGRW